MIGKLYKYPKTGTVYKVLQEVKMKDPSTGEWEEAIIYTDRNSTYCREKEDFIAKFELYGEREIG